MKMKCQNKKISKCINKRFYSESTETLRKTKLHNFHLKHGGKMVPFCGWDMPVQYEGKGIIDSHLHTRQNASLFDVSHMCQLRFTGKDRVQFLEKLVVGSIGTLKNGNARLSLITNEKGGIIDDTIITKQEDHLYVVINAGCAEKDIEHLTKHLSIETKNGLDVKMEIIDKSLVALQGPKAREVMRKLIPKDFNLDSMEFMSGRNFKLGNLFNVYMTRCGYTGEDGFEISVDHKDVEDFSSLLLKNEEVALAGLGARDTLRLESGLCLYGNDIDENTTPVEASLLWTIPQERRISGGFLGAKYVLEQIQNKSEKKKRVGIQLPRPPHPHLKIFDSNGKEIGEVTSGSFSPVLKSGIGMAYVSKEFSKIGTQIFLEFKNKKVPATVSKMPFVPTNYWTLPK
eukprot:TRINITY_DN17207_c0_g1_i1.p1 TRINITY_DN17207_c0_g1~~TRINITY_DN17207_c0_g1_i1.p1  ORF type:complete len:400 (-),score=137.08 TRINITY_DN17207_c0_g1_i1:73-1272(-)